MGLDQYIYREKKDSFNKRKELKTLIKTIEHEYYIEHKDEVDEASYKVFELGKKNLNGEYDEEIHKLRTAFTEKHKDFYDRKTALQTELDGLYGNIRELACWRKFWTLQGYLERLLGNAENCKDSVLTKDNLKTIVDDFTKAVNTKDSTIIGEFSESDIDDTWGEIAYAKDIFKEILDSYDDDYVYYYHPWW